MRQESLARDYASALFSLAGEQKISQAVAEDLQRASSIFFLDDRLLNFIQSPAIPVREKIDFVHTVFKGRKLSLSFYELLVRRKAFYLIPLIAGQYKRLLDESEGREPVEITSAFELDGKKQGELTATLNALLKKTVVPKFAVDPALVAGLVVRCGDRIIDGSMRTQFAVLKEELTKEHL